MAAYDFIRFNPAHYFRDAHHLTTLQHGAYFLLLMAMFSAGGRLPCKRAQLARIAKCSIEEWEDIRPVLMPFFTRDGNFITQSRITREIEHIRQVTEARKIGLQNRQSEKDNKFKRNRTSNVGHDGIKSSQSKIPTEEDPYGVSSSDRNADAKLLPLERQASICVDEEWAKRQLAKLALVGGTDAVLP